MPTSLIGRAAVVRHLVDLLAEPGARALVVGEAGLGKSTVVDAVVAACPPTMQVVRMVATEVEKTVGLTSVQALTRSLVAHGARADAATMAALGELLDPGGTDLPGSLVLSAALGRLLGSIAVVEPVLLVIDDLHWFDAMSAGVVHGALRRASAVDLRVLAATRGPRPLPLPDAVVIALEPLPESALRDIVDGRLGQRLSPELGRRLAATVGGNPLFALEIARGLPGDATVDDIRLPLTLADGVSGRLRALPATCRRALVELAVRSEAPWSDIDDPASLEAAVADGLVEHDGRVLRFVHPIYARAALDIASPDELRRAHATAAAAAGDPLESARHLAESRPSPDEPMALRLEEAAALLLARGDLVTAELVARSSVLTTPATSPRSARWRRAYLRAQALEALDALAEDAGRDLLALAGSADEVARSRMTVVSDVHARGELLHELIRDPDLSLPVRLVVANELLAAELFRGQHRAGVDVVAALLPHEPPRGAEREWAEVVAGIALMRRLLGQPVDRAALDRACDLTADGYRPSRTMAEGPSTSAGLIALYDDDIASATRLLAEPALASPDNPTGEAFHAIELWCRTGQIRRARSFVDTGVGWFVDDAFAFAYALVSAWEGDVDRCRREAELASELAERYGDVMYPQGVNAALALLELGTGDAEAAWHLADDTSRILHQREWVEPSIFPVLPIAVEAAAWTGRVAEGYERLGWLESAAQEIPSRWAAAMASRGRGHLRAVTGDPEPGLSLVEQSAVAFAELGLAGEQARSLLVAGQLARRSGLRGRARPLLEQAAELLRECGIHGFARLADLELARLGGRRSAGPALTDSERQVAELVARGASNREAAAALFLSVKTVETHLSRVYLKLGVRNRTELAARWSG